LYFFFKKLIRGMKRQRTGTFKARRVPTLPTVAGQATGANRRLTSAEKKEVKQLIAKAAPKSIVHNSATSGVPPVTGVLASAITSILAFTATKQGLAEDQRRGDQIWIHKIHFKCFLTSTSIEDTVRIMVARSPAISGTPLPIDWTNILQNAGAGTPGVISTIQDDQPYQILYDHRHICGNKSANWGSKVVEFTLDFSKRPLKCIYVDNTATSSPATTIMGNIELAAATQSAATTTMTYVYDVEFSEK
jgi:hypothetical protein